MERATHGDPLALRLSETLLDLNRYPAHEYFQQSKLEANNTGSGATVQNPKLTYIS